MQAFREFSSQVIPLPLDEVDTDQIIPAAFLTSVSREGYGENLFRGLRERDESFVLNDMRYQGRSILLAGDNFGCGSSREHAVWALTGYGIKVVIGKSFADIFSSNSAKNGLLLIQLPAQQVDALFARIAADDSTSLEVSLEEQVVRVVGEQTQFPFEYDSFRKHCLLQGLDDIDYIRSKQESIETFRRKQAERVFTAVE